MEAVAERLFNLGDMKSAASLYNNLMMLHPRYMKMARICRVLADPSDVPLPHRYADIIEALLCPTITAGALFGAGTTAPVVNKSYQRWTLLLHPDKNPYPRAGEAFARLGALRAWALELSDQPTQQPEGRGANDKAGATPVPSRTTAGERNVSLEQLRKTQITLKSLKRKDIDDDALPELRRTFRDVLQQRFYSQPTSPLASTVPAIPTSFTSPSGSPQMPAPVSSFPQAKETLESQGVPLETPQPESPCPQTPAQSCTVEESPSGKSTAEQSMSQPGLSHSTVSQQSSVSRVEDKQSHVHEQKLCATHPQTKQTSVKHTQSQAATTSRPARRGVCDSRLKSVRPCTIKRPKKNAPATEPRENSAPEGSAEPTMSSPHDCGPPGEEQNVVPTDVGSDTCLSNVAKKSIIDLIQHLQAVKENTRVIRLGCDLSFEAYQREKEQQQQQQQQDVKDGAGECP